MKRTGWSLGAFVLALGLISCGGGADEAGTAGEGQMLPEGAEAFSLLGEPLFPNPARAEVAARQGRDVRGAREDYEADPERRGRNHLAGSARRIYGILPRGDRGLLGGD